MWALPWMSGHQLLPGATMDMRDTMQRHSFRHRKFKYFIEKQLSVISKYRSLPVYISAFEPPDSMIPVRLKELYLKTST